MSVASFATVNPAFGLLSGSAVPAPASPDGARCRSVRCSSGSEDVSGPSSPKCTPCGGSCTTSRATTPSSRHSTRLWSEALQPQHRQRLVIGRLGGVGLDAKPGPPTRHRLGAQQETGEGRRGDACRLERELEQTRTGRGLQRGAIERGVLWAEPADRERTV